MDHKLWTVNTDYIRSNNFDIVSAGELERVLKAGGSPEKIIFSGVGKTREELQRAIEIGVGCINDLLRPALYEAFQDIKVISENENIEQLKRALYDIVGPVCETADFLGKERELSLTQGTLLGIFQVGAYGFSMSSNYNSRPRPPEIMVDGARVHLIRPKETYQDLFGSECIIT